MAHPTFTCSGQLREASLDYSTPQSISPYDPELLFALDFDDDWSDLEDDRRDPLMDWIELDGLTLVDTPHITAGGSLTAYR